MATTEFDDSQHFGIFTTSATLTSQTGKMVRQSELVLAALRAQGVFDTLVDSTAAPTHDKLWLDKNSDPAVLKEWDSVGSAWEEMTFDRLFGRAIVTALTNVGGTADAITVERPSTFIDNRLYSITPAASNTGATTIQVMGVGTYSVKYHDGTALDADEFVGGQNTVLLFTNGRFEILLPFAGVYAAQLAAEAAADRAEAAAASIDYLSVADIAALKAVDPAEHTSVYLRQGFPALHGRFGMFAFNNSDLASEVAADTTEAIHVAPNSDLTGASGAWVRQFNGSLFPEWFGAVGDDAVTDDQAALNAALALAIAMGGGSIELQTRRYRMSASLTGSLPKGTSVRLYGQGKDNSELVFDAGVDGLKITVDGDSRNDGAIFIYDDFSLTTLSLVEGIAATFTGIRSSGMTTAMLESSRVKMKGASTAQGWAKGAAHDNMNGCDYVMPEWLGAQSDKTANAWEFTGVNNPTDIRLVAPRATWFKHAVDVSGTIEGIMVTTPMFVAGVWGVYHNTPAGEPQLEVHGGHVNANAGGVYSARAIQSVVEGVLIYEDISGGAATWTAVSLNNGDHNKVYGNTIHSGPSAATSRYGIILGSSPRRTLVYGNTFRGYTAANKLTAGIVFDGTQDGSVREFGNVFDDATVALRVSGGGDTASKENRMWSNSIIVTLAGGAATETIDVALPAGFLSDKPVDATLTEQSGIQFLVAQFQRQDAATTKSNARFLVTRADGANIAGAATQFGVSVRG